MTPTRTQALILTTHAYLAKTAHSEKERAHHAARLAHLRGRLGESPKAVDERVKKALDRKTLDERIKAIEKILKSDRQAYNKDPQLQAEYLDLLTKREDRGLPPGS